MSGKLQMMQTLIDELIIQKWGLECIGFIVRLHKNNVINSFCVEHMKVSHEQIGLFFYSQTVDLEEFGLSIVLTEWISNISIKKRKHNKVKIIVELSNGYMDLIEIESIY